MYYFQYWSQSKNGSLSSSGGSPSSGKSSMFNATRSLQQYQLGDESRRLRLLREYKSEAYGASELSYWPLPFWILSTFFPFRKGWKYVKNRWGEKILVVEVSHEPPLKKANMYLPHLHSNAKLNRMWHFNFL